MEPAVLLLVIFLERRRLDLGVRRAWAKLGVPRPALPIRVPMPVALAGIDLRRLSLRVSMVGVAYLLYRGYAPGPPRDDVYEGVNRLIGFGPAALGLVVMAILASTSGRDRGNELLASLPGSARSRVWGWAVGLTGVAVLAYLLLLWARFGHAATSYEALMPDAWDLAQGPIMILGGGLLGLLAARLVPGWVATPVVVVLGVMWVGTFSSVFGLQMLAPLIELIEYHEDDRIVVEQGNFAWHNGYLLGLCALGVVAALLREGGSRRALFVSGTLLVAATTVAGALALP